MIPFGSNCHTDPDFPRTFCNGNQHDVHDPDAAYHDGNTGNGSQQNGHFFGDTAENIGKLSLVADGEIVRSTRTQLMGLPQHLSDLCRCCIHRILRHGRNQDHIDVGGIHQPSERWTNDWKYPMEYSLELQKIVNHGARSGLFFLERVGTFDKSDFLKGIQSME